MESDAIKHGPGNAAHRSLYHALGLTEEELDRPLVGIVSSYNEIVPGHMNLDKITEAVKLGVAMAGGTPIVFPAIAVCDGIAMGHVGMKYSLVTRDLIADSTEAMALAHGFDALVMVPNCDKNVPGLLMAAARLNVPTVFVSGGPMLAGHVKGAKTSLSSMFEAQGAHAAGKMSEEDLEDYARRVCPTCGSCSGMYTANSMNCLTEVLGMGLKGNGTIPAVYSRRIELAKHAGMAVMDMLAKNIRPRDIMTREAFENALAVDMALGCSTNSMLHLPAIAYECGIDIDLAVANEISAKTPNLCHLAPSGRTYMEELDEAGGVYAVMNELSKKGLLHEDCITVTGKTVGENIADCPNLDPECDPAGGRALLRDRRHCGAPRQPGPRRLCGQARRRGPRDAGARGPGPRVRVRGGRPGGYQRRADQPRRRGGHPLRGPQGRPRHARDAEPHLGHHGHGAGHQRGAHHRRPL